MFTGYNKLVMLNYYGFNDLYQSLIKVRHTNDDDPCQMIGVKYDDRRKPYTLFVCKDAETMDNVSILIKIISLIRKLIIYLMRHYQSRALDVT